MASICKVFCQGCWCLCQFRTPKLQARGGVRWAWQSFRVELHEFSIQLVDCVLEGLALKVVQEPFFGILETLVVSPRQGRVRGGGTVFQNLQRYTSYPVVRGLANVNDEHTFLEDGYQWVRRTRQRASLNGCLGNNVELFPKFFFFFFFGHRRTAMGWGGSTKNDEKDDKSRVRVAWAIVLFSCS